MGQRSQIYVRINKPDGKYDLVARYFPWNLHTLMISRARHTIQWLKTNEDSPRYLLKGCDGYKILPRIIDVNFDYHDICISSDILDQVRKGFFTRTEDIFHEDNDNGKLLIDMNIDWKSKKVFDYKVKFKYAFIGCNNELIGNGDAYMEWDADPLWKENDFFKSDVSFTEHNIRYIDKHAKLMTQEEVNEYISHDYIRDMDLIKEEQEIPLF